METELQAFLAAQIPAIPFYDTENLRQEPRDELWVTIRHDDTYTTPACYSGAKRIKDGGLDIFIFLRAGQGSTPAIVLADAIEDHFYGRDLGNGIVVTNAESAVNVTNGDADPWFGVLVAVDYQFTIY
jgi:hypothetical protein